MGVYHVSGLGIYPGALSVPLSTLYILQIGQYRGKEAARNFFASSGEAERKGSQEKTRGQIECVIVFTSKEVVEGKRLEECKSKWFQLDFKKGKSLQEVYSRFFNELFYHIEKEFNFRPKEFELYVVRVDHTNFEDCFIKIGTTLKALVGKEVWANMIGGTNQINMATLTAGAYIATVSKYYYLFQNDPKLLEPEWAEKPKKENIESLVISAIEKWHEIPIFNLDLGKIITRLRDEFSVREKINLGELRQILQELGLGKDYIPKLRSFLVIKDDLVEKSPIFDRLVGFWQKLDEMGIKNFAEWKKWANEGGILSEIEVFS